MRKCNIGGRFNNYYDSLDLNFKLKLYPLLATEMGSQKRQDLPVDTAFLEPLLNGWFLALTQYEVVWRSNFELLVEVALVIVICKRHSPKSYKLPRLFEETVFDIQQKLVNDPRAEARRHTPLPRPSVYYLGNNPQSGTQRHQSYHTNVLVALLMVNYSVNYKLRPGGSNVLSVHSYWFHSSQYKKAPFLWILKSRFNCIWLGKTRVPPSNDGFI